MERKAFLRAGNDLSGGVILHWRHIKQLQGSGVELSNITGEQHLMVSFHISRKDVGYPVFQYRSTSAFWQLGSLWTSHTTP